MTPGTLKRTFETSFITWKTDTSIPVTPAVTPQINDPAIAVEIMALENALKPSTDIRATEPKAFGDKRLISQWSKIFSKRMSSLRI